MRDCASTRVSVLYDNTVRVRYLRGMKVLRQGQKYRRAHGCLAFYFARGWGTGPNPRSRIPRIADIYITLALIGDVASQPLSLSPAGCKVSAIVNSSIERYTGIIITISASLCIIAHNVWIISELQYISPRCRVLALRIGFNLGRNPEIRLPMLWWVITHVTFSICAPLPGDVRKTCVFHGFLHPADLNNLVALTKAQLQSQCLLGVVVPVFELLTFCCPRATFDPGEYRHTLCTEITTFGNTKGVAVFCPILFPYI